MNRSALSLHTVSLRLSNIALLVAAFFMPFSEACKVTFVIFLAAFAFTRVLHIPVLTFLRPSRTTAPLYLAIAFYLWIVITMLWTQNTDEGIHVLLKRLALFIAPLLALFRIPNERYNVDKVLLAFFLGVLCLSIIRPLASIPENLDQPLESLRWQYANIYRGDIPNRLGMHMIHPTVMGVLQCFAIATLAYLKHPLFIKGDKKRRNFYYSFFAFVYILFLTLIYFSMARMALIIFFAVSAIVVIVFLWNRHHRKAMFLAFGVIALGGSWALLSSPRMEHLELSSEKLQQFDPRYEQWRCGLIAISENNTLLGVGVGDGTDTFNEVHARPTFQQYFYDVESAHCLWIDGTIEFGIIGCLLLVAIFITNCFFYRLRVQHVFVISFSVIWLLFTLTEPFLSRFIPIYVFTFFLLVSFWMKTQNNE